MTKKYFPGGNTKDGFYNLFTYINPSAYGHTIILKGGPGVGKNTLMKKLAAAALNKNKQIEYFFCSGDPDSLDAIRILPDNLVVLDGTAPHIIDPKYPGLYDEIINLGTHIKSDGLRCNAQVLLDLFERNSCEYAMAYSYLNTAGMLNSSNYNTINKIYNKDYAGSVISGLLQNHDDTPHTRILFLDAITCKGLITFSTNIEEKAIVYKITGNATCNFFADLLNATKQYEREVYLNPLMPTVPAHIYLKNANIWFVSEQMNVPLAKSIISTEEFLTESIPEFVEYNNSQISNLIDKSIIYLRNCKSIHDDIEAIYKENVDFDGVEMDTEKLISKL